VQSADLIAVLAKGTHEARKNNDPRICEDPANLPSASDIFAAILRREPKVPVESMSKIITVDPIAESPSADEQRFDSDCDCALARARQSSQPNGRPTLREKALSVLPADCATVPNDIR
jgi:hypothetical protein